MKQQEIEDKLSEMDIEPQVTDQQGNRWKRVVWRGIYNSIHITWERVK